MNTPIIAAGDVGQASKEEIMSQCLAEYKRGRGIATLLSCGQYYTPFLPAVN